MKCNWHATLFLYSAFLEQSILAMHMHTCSWLGMILHPRMWGISGWTEIAIRAAGGSKC